MKKDKKALIKKIVILLIVILIPLLASVGIGIYGYNRYSSEYFDVYMNKVEEDTEAKVKAYIQYISYTYEKEPFYEEEVLYKDERVLTMKVYRVIAEGLVTNDDGEQEAIKQLQYHFTFYNFDYTKVVAIKSLEEKLTYNNIPTIYLKVTDNDNSDNTEVLTLSVPGDMYFYEDYNAKPKKDYKGNELYSYLQWVTYIPDEDYSNDCHFELLMSDKPSDQSNAAYYKIITEFDLENLEQDYADIDTSNFVTGYENNYKKAGYFGYILKDKLWWQVLIALAITGFISYLFYLIWTDEETTKETVTAKPKRRK